MNILEKINLYRTKIGPNTEVVPVPVGDLQDILNAAEAALAMMAPGPGNETLDSFTGAPCVGGAAFGTVVPKI